MSELLFSLLVLPPAFVAGAIASIAGFGIGSVLTPILALTAGTRLAVAAVSIPHLAGTVQRLWALRRSVDRAVLLSFGLTSAVGGLLGALAHTRVSSRALRLVFGLLLLLAATAELTGWVRTVHWGRRAAWIAGALSGALGGLVGNQGGIRSAAMLGLSVPKEAFVATATAVALFVDVARIPVYVATQGRDITRIWPLVLAAAVGVMVGTALGTRILGSLPERTFRRAVALLLTLLGLYMLLTAGSMRSQHV